MIELASDQLKVQLHPRGAALAGLWMQRYQHSLVLGALDPSAYGPDLDFFGAIVGPIANRVGGGVVEIDDTIYKLDANEGINCLHGGANGLFARTWDVVEHDANRAVFRMTLADKEDGLPGNREFDVSYSLPNQNVLRLDITVRTDSKTPINIAHHPYWNLNGQSTIGDHYLEIPAEHFLPVNSELLPTGAMSPVTETVYDFRASKKVVTDITLDVNLCLSNQRLRSPRRCATLTAPDAPRLEIHSTEPGLQVYNGTGLSELPVTLHDGHAPVASAGIALEPQGWPDAMHHSHFPSTLVDPDTIYHQVTEYRLYG